MLYFNVTPSLRQKIRMLRLIIYYILYASYTGIRTFGYPNAPIQFPLRNIQNSIGLNYNSTFHSNFTSEFYRHYKSDGYILNLPNLNLQSAPNPYPGFIESQKVAAINLRENGIYQISPDSFNSVPNVQYLDLSRNRLALCDFFNYGSCVQNLITLAIEENESPTDGHLYEDISKAGCFPQLCYLYLRNNCIKRLNFSLKQSFPSLVALYLSNNEIDDCAFVRDVPSLLAYLYVDRNRLSSIDTRIITNLKSLSADENKIETICYASCDSSSLQLLGTTKLEILSLARNRITRIESCAFRDTYSLVCLNLAGNEIGEIHPSSLVPLRALAQLNLDDNRLTSVPNLRGNWHLKALSLRNNRITEIKREHFSETKTLQKLLLGANCISSIESDVFDDLSWLQVLDLSSNKIESLPSGWMGGLTNLKCLDLRNNRFMHVHQLALSVSLCLKEFHLEDNKYTQSDRSSIQVYCPNSRIYLDSCSYNSSLRAIDDYKAETYWEMNTQEKTDFSYKLNLLRFN